MQVEAVHVRDHAAALAAVRMVEHPRTGKAVVQQRIEQVQAGLLAQLAHGGVIEPLVLLDEPARQRQQAASGRAAAAHQQHVAAAGHQRVDRDEHRRVGRLRPLPAVVVQGHPFVVQRVGIGQPQPGLDEAAHLLGHVLRDQRGGGLARCAGRAQQRRAQVRGVDRAGALARQQPPWPEALEVVAGGVLEVADQRGVGRAGCHARHRRLDGGHPARVVVVVAHRHERHARRLLIGQRQPDHRLALGARERVARRARLMGRADHHHHAPPERERLVQKRRMAVVKRLEASDQDDHLVGELAHWGCSKTCDR